MKVRPPPGVPMAATNCTSTMVRKLLSRPYQPPMSMYCRNSSIGGCIIHNTLVEVLRCCTHLQHSGRFKTMKVSWICSPKLGKVHRGLWLELGDTSPELRRSPWRACSGHPQIQLPSCPQGVHTHPCASCPSAHQSVKTNNTLCTDG